MKIRSFATLCVVVSLAFGCQSTPGPAEQSPDEARHAETSASTDESTDSAKSSEASNDADALSQKQLREAAAEFDTVIHRLVKRGKEQVNWSRLLGPTPEVTFAGAFGSKVERFTDIASFGRALEKYTIDGLCVPELVDCQQGCCAFETSTSDGCAHHGVSVTQACFAPSKQKAKSTEFRLTEMWLQCPFDYEPVVESSAPDCLNVSVQKGAAGEYACRPPVRYLLMVENQCGGEFSSSLPQLQDKQLEVYKLGGCDKFECTFEDDAELDGEPVTIEISLTLEPKFRDLASFFAHARARGYTE